MITCDGCNARLGPSYNERAQRNAKLLTATKYVETLADDIQRQEIKAELCNACYIRATNLMAAVFEDFLAAGAQQAGSLCIYTNDSEADIAKGRNQASIEWWNRMEELSEWLRQRKADRMAKAASFPLSTMDAVEATFDEVIAKLNEVLCKRDDGGGERCQ